MHKVSCTTGHTDFEIGFIWTWGKDDSITLAEDSQPIKGWEFWCGDGEDRVLANIDEHIGLIECETVDSY